MVIYRPHKGGLKEAMAEAKESNSIDEMKQYVCDEHNRLIPWFQIKPTDIYIQDTESSDERVKWHNLFYLLYERASKISDIKGYCRYMGISEDNLNLSNDDRDIYFLKDEPMGVIGMCSTDYERKND